MRKQDIILLTMLTALIFAVPGSTETLAKLSLDEMIDRSQYIVIGEIKEIENNAGLDDKCGLITKSALAIKKKVFGSDDISYLEITHCNIDTFDHPIFDIGERYILFIQDLRNSYRVTQGRHGMLLITNGFVNPHNILGYSDEKVSVNDFIKKLSAIIQKSKSNN